MRVQQAGADVGDHGDADPASSPTSTDRVNPRTTKFDGWIFSTAPVSGPRAAV